MADDDSIIIKVDSVGDSDYGIEFDHKDFGQVFQILISHNKTINSLQFQYVVNGTLVLSERLGSDHGNKFSVVKLDYPAEYITSISGHYNYRYDRISSIKFGTNHGEYGPFGGFDSDDGDKEFSFSLGDRQFGGFHGTVSEIGLKSIGVYFKPIMTLDYSPDRSVNKPEKEGKSC